MLVEKFHQLLNKSVTIAIEDRKKFGCFTEAGIVAGYAWNSAPIDGTDIIRSIPAISRKLRFPIDISSVTLPQLTTNQADSVVNYLRLTDSSKHFASEILKILIEDRCTVHRERINNQRNIVSFDVGDVVMARREVQSNKSTNKVGKLCYQVRGPFVIVKPTGTGGYMVTKFGKSDGPKLRYIAEELYALPPTLLPCDLVDGSDIKYLNHSHPSVLNPLKVVLDIVSYDNFSSPNLTVPPKFDYDRYTLRFIHHSKSTPFPSIVELHDESNTVPPSPVVDPQSDILISPHTPHALSLILPASDKLFFIQYIPTGSI